MDLETMIKEVKRNEKFLFMSDTHCEVEDTKAIKLVAKVAEDQQPHNIIFGGDMIDAYIASKFRKDFCRVTLQDEVDGFIEDIYKPMLEACPKANFYYLEGNHEARLSGKVMEEHAFAGIRLLTFENILNESCKTAGVKKIKYDTELLITDHGNPIYLFKHGNKANKYAANSELELENISGMSGHIHRFDRRYKTTRAGTINWLGVGHLSDVSKQKYVAKHSNKAPNWQQGFGFVNKYKNNMFAEGIRITPEYKCCVSGKEYK